MLDFIFWSVICLATALMGREAWKEMRILHEVRKLHKKMDSLD